MSDEFTMKALEENYKALLKLRHERAQAEQSLAEIDERIAKITPKVIGLAALVDEVPEDSELGQFLIETASMGITDAVRTVLRSTPGLMQPLDVRNALIRMGVNLRDYKNQLAVIGSTLKRLEESGEVVKSTPQGKPWYSWSRPRDLPPIQNPTLEAMLAPLKKKK